MSFGEWEEKEAQFAQLTQLTKADFSWQLEVADAFGESSDSQVDTELPPRTLTCI